MCHVRALQAMEQGGAPNAIHVSADFSVALEEAGLPEGLLLVLATGAADGSFFLEQAQHSPGATTAIGATPAPLRLT